MFRKITHIALVLTLLIATIGFSASKHYCGDRLVSVSINSEANSCCDSGDCCHNETDYFQLNEDYVFTVIINDIQIHDIDLLFPVVFTILQAEPEAETLSGIVYSESPPPPKIQTVLSLFQAYLC